MSEPKKHFTPEFRAEAVRLARTSGRSRREIAADLGVGLSTLRAWIDGQRDREMEEPSPDRQENMVAELKRLRRENEGCCQTNANASRFRQTRLVSAGAERPPLGKSGGAVQLEELAAREASIRAEMVGDGGVDGDELLETSQTPEALHGSLSPS